MSVLVKVCGITTLDDALLSVDAGADALGFNFWPRSPRYITPDDAARITLNLQKTTLRVGVFVDPAIEEVLNAMRIASLDVAQIHGASPTLLNVRYWQALEASADLAERMRASDAEAFLVDTPAGAARGGTGKSFDWTLARALPKRLVLAGGLGPDNVADALRTVHAWGVDACSRLERAPGRKDAMRVRDFVRAVREAESL